MGILSWLFGSSKQSNTSIKDSDENNDGYSRRSLFPAVNHGGGKHITANGGSYERFRPTNDVAKRETYKIDQSFEVKGTHVRKNEINKICNWLAKAGENAKVRANLEREPTNQYDPNAIKLIITADGLSDTVVGYMPKEMAAQLQGQLPMVELESIYQRDKIHARTLIKRRK
jgi:hypothetical protein